MVNDHFIDSEEIGTKLKEIENEEVPLALKLSLLTQKINYIFSKIKSCESIEVAHGYFNLLDEIQCVLSRLIFKQEIGIPERLWRFVKDFDNLEQDRKYFFDKIKNGRYSF